MKWEGRAEGRRAVVGAAERAFTDFLQILSREYSFTISSEGVFPGYAGDIVDAGFFRASLGRPSFRQPAPGVDYRPIEGEPPAPTLDAGDLVGVFVWHAEYSLLLHEGWTTRGGETKAGRPWTTETHKRLDMDGIFAKLFQRELRSVG